MPGIVGLITRQPRALAEAQLAQMVEALRHEPFHTTGTWVDEKLGVYVGWCARKGSFADGMPLQNERGDVVLAYAGDEFSSAAAASFASRNGDRTKGPSYLVRLYEEDPTFPANLNGMFHGLLVDRRKQSVFLFNDRYGMHRLYYHEARREDAFYFAAEAKAILAVRPELRRADSRGLGEFIACGCVLENRTVFEDVHVLPGGAMWRFREGALEPNGKQSYFQPSQWEEQSPLDSESYYRELREVLGRSLPRYFEGPERVGLALTGGLDTRVIMALRKAPPHSLPCYTFGSERRDCQDVIVARQVAEACGQSHQAIPLGNGYLKNFASYAERTMYLTEGCVDVSRSSDLYFSEKVRAIAPAKVVGTYGSEILCSLAMFKPGNPLPGLFHADLLAEVERAGDTYDHLRREHPVTFAAFRQSPWYHYGILSLEQSQLTVRSPFLDDDFVRTVYRAPKSAAGNGDLRLRLIANGNPALARIRSDRGVVADSEHRSGGMTRRLLEFSFKAEYAYDYGMPPWLAKIDHAFSPFHFERLFLGRHKLSHFRIWYRDTLAEYVREMLLDSRSLSRPYLDRKRVEAIVQDHTSGKQNYTSAIHKLLSLELLHRLFFDSPAAAC
jgi:asparagine synthase (glutamine-hydrolysing)